MFNPLVQQKQPFLKTLSGGGHVGVLLLDELGCIVDVNPAGQFLLGRPLNELIGYELGRVPGMMSDDDHPIEINCISGDGKLRFCELRMYLSDVKLLTNEAESFQIAAAVASGIDADAIYIGTLYDVTPYRDAAVTAQAEVVRRDDFLATLSHELRNPLSAITGGFELLRQPDLEPETRDEASQVIDQQLTQLRRLLDDLLDMTRLAHHRVELKREPCDLRKPIQAAVKMAVVLIDQDAVEPRELLGSTDMGASKGDDDGEETGLELAPRVQINLPDEPLTIDGDAARLEQLVANLLTNALKYSDSRTSVRIQARRFGTQQQADEYAREAAGPRRLNTESAVAHRITPGPGGVIELCVIDEGSGIAPDLLPHLFDPFVQAQRTFGRSDGGFGIGLTLVRDLASLHGGTVWAESEGIGKGATFVVHLPAELPQQAKPDAPARTEDLPSLKLLLVEDVPAIRKVTAKLLERLGHDVVQAGDVPSAVLALESQSFDLGLIDIGLPGPSGLVLGEKVRENAAWSSMRLIALTGYGQEADRERSREAGFDQHLVKPFDLKEFTALVRTLFT